MIYDAIIPRSVTVYFDATRHLDKGERLVYNVRERTLRDGMSNSQRGHF